MIVFIRADASVTIGSGHVIRCLTLAHALRGKNISCIFLCRKLPGDLIEVIQTQGFQVVIVLSDGHDGWECDARNTRSIISNSGNFPDWLIVDHYELDFRWEQELRAACRNLMVIDDLADRPHACDLLLDQNRYKKQQDCYLKLAPGSRILLGPSYALLRNEFATLRVTRTNYSGKVKRILVFFGGSDPSNETEKALEALDSPAFRNIIVDVVVGISNPNRIKISTLCAIRPNTFYFCQISNMAERMAQADLSIGAGGTSTWERMALGLPSIVVSVAQNQEMISNFLADQGLIQYLGRASEVDISTMANAIKNMYSSPEKLKSMSRMGMASVDGAGTDRVVSQLMEYVAT